jgi:transcriptional regulator with XRE-family HTH domain
MGRQIGTNTKRTHTTPEEAIGAVITDLRLRRRWSQMETAEKLGYSGHYINEVELGRRSPTHGMLAETAALFGLRPSQLLARAEQLYLKPRERTSRIRAKDKKSTRSRA